MKRLWTVAILLLLPLSAFTQMGEDRPVLAVLDFAAAGVSEAEARVYTEVLSTRIVSSNAYRVIDREQREAILQEIEFSLSDCSDESCQLEAGRLLSASRLVVGSIGRIGIWFIASARLIDVASGQTLRSVSEKYLSVEALLDGATALAGRTLGQPLPGPETLIAEPQSARTLISSVKQKQLQQRLDRMQRRMRADRYASWLKTHGFAEYERVAAIEEKMAFLEEYLYQTNTRGHAVDFALAFSRLNGRSLAGATAAWIFQFNSHLSAGVSANFSMLLQPAGFGSAGVGPLLVFGDKVDSFAVLVSAGFGGASGPMFPVRCGLYFRNFYLGYAGQFPLGDGDIASGLEAGYSLFLGERRTWPPKDK
jgi:hypothetical protein